MIQLTNKDVQRISELTARRDQLVDMIARLDVIIEKGVTEFSLKIEGWNHNGMGKQTVIHSWYQDLCGPYGDDMAAFSLGQLQLELSTVEDNIAGYGIDYKGPEQAA